MSCTSAAPTMPRGQSTIGLRGPLNFHNRPIAQQNNDIIGATVTIYCPNDITIQATLVANKILIMPDIYDPTKYFCGYTFMDDQGNRGEVYASLPQALFHTNENNQWICTIPQVSWNKQRSNNEAMFTVTLGRPFTEYLQKLR